MSGKTPFLVKCQGIVREFPSQLDAFILKYLFDILTFFCVFQIKYASLYHKKCFSQENVLLYQFYRGGMHNHYGNSNKYHDTKWVVVSVIYHISISTHFWHRVSISPAPPWLKSTNMSYQGSNTARPLLFARIKSFEILIFSHRKSKLFKIYTDSCKEICSQPLPQFEHIFVNVLA